MSGAFAAAYITQLGGSSQTIEPDWRSASVIGEARVLGNGGAVPQTKLADIDTSKNQMIIVVTSDDLGVDTPLVQGVSPILAFQQNVVVNGDSGSGSYLTKWGGVDLFDASGVFVLNQVDRIYAPARTTPLPDGGFYSLASVVKDKLIMFVNGAGELIWEDTGNPAIWNNAIAVCIEK